MVLPISSNPQVPNVTAAAPSASDATTAGAVASTHGTANVDSNTKIETMEQLRKRAPKVYNAMVQGIGMEICREMEHHQDRLKKLMREGERQG